jgi:hypothetical protein
MNFGINGVFPGFTFFCGASFELRPFQITTRYMECNRHADIQYCQFCSFYDSSNGSNGLTGNNESFEK